MRKIVFSLCLAVAPLLVMHTGAAQAAYPEQTIRIIVPFAPGGIADGTARLIADGLSKNLGKPVIVENRVGGATTIGTQVVAKAHADGYTLLLASTNISTNAALYKTLPYNADKDLVPVALTVITPGVIITHPSLPVKSFAELLNYAKQNPEKITYASVGLGSFSHLAIETLKQKTSINMLHVPYKGYAPALASVVSGETDLLASDLQGALQFIEMGKLKVLAVTGARRLSALPDVPTVSELGVRDFQAVGWLGIMAPAGTPANIVSRLNTEINKILQNPEVVKRYSAQGAEIFSGDPDAFRKFLNENKTGWENVIRTAKITLD